MPEVGLLFQLIAGVSLAVCSQAETPSFVLIFTGVVLFVGSLGLIFGNGTAIILNYFPNMSGSANATIGVSRFIISTITSSIIAFFHTGDLKIIGVVMFACTFIANAFFYTFMLKKTKTP